MSSAPLPPDPRDAASGSPRERRLREAVLTQVRRRGSLRFDEFLEIVLYDPADGYYAGSHEVVGRRGDFKTAPEAHPLFGATWATYVEETWEDLGRPRELPLVELGPGRGYLLEGLLGELRRQGHPGERFPVHLVDVGRPRSGPLADPSGLPVPVTWSGSVEELPPFPEAVVLANEFFDALPFRRFRHGKGTWQEVAVVEDPPGGLAWGPGPPVDARTLAELPTGAPEGVVYDAPLRATTTLRTLLGRVSRGRVVISDYGDRAELLFARHPEGSLATYHRHHPGTDPFRHLGEQDLSCWVDFSGLTEAFESAGWRPDPLRTQAEALLEAGLSERAGEWRARAGEESAEGVLAQLAVKTFLLGYPNHQVLSASRDLRPTPVPP